MIDGQVKPFIEAFEGSKHVPPAEEMVVLLEEEYKKAAAGGLKLDGKWITPEVRIADAYELDARMSYDDFNSAAEASKFVQAFREFESFEGSFTGSGGHYEKSVEFAKTLLRAYQTQGEDRFGSDRRKAKEACSGAYLFGTGGETNRRRQDRATSFLIRKAVEKENGPVERSGSLLRNITRAPWKKLCGPSTGMTRRLEVLDLSKIEPIDPIYKQALAAVSGGNPEKARELLAKLTSMGLPASYITVLEEPLPTEDTETPTPPPGSGGSDPAPESPSDSEKADCRYSR